MLESQTGPHPNNRKKSKCLVIFIRRRFRGGPVEGFMGGGQSRDIFRGGPVKKITLFVGSTISDHATSSVLKSWECSSFVYQHKTETMPLCRNFYIIHTSYFRLKLIPESQTTARLCAEPGK